MRFFDKRSTIVGKKRIFAIDKNVDKVIVKDILMPPQTSGATGYENGESNCPCNGVPPGDHGMRVFQSIYVSDEENANRNDDASKVVSCYHVALSNPLQFDYVVSLLAARLSVRQILQVVLENRYQLGCEVNQAVCQKAGLHAFPALCAQLSCRCWRTL